MSVRSPSSPLAVNPFLLLCVSGLLAIFSSTMSKSPILPLFARHLGASDADIGFVAAASTVVGILVSIPAGALSDLYGRRRVILVAAFVFASAPFLYLLVSAPWHLVVVRIYHGFATAIFGPVAMALVADLFSAGRGESMGWYSSSTLIGRSVAPVVGGAILSLGAAGGVVGGFSGYQGVYIVCGLSGLLSLLVATRLPGVTTALPTGETEIRKRWMDAAEGLRQIVRSRLILSTSVMEAAQYFAYGAIETFLPLYAISIGLADWQIGAILGAQLLTTALSKPVMGRTSDSAGRRLMIILGLTLSGLTILGIAITASLRLPVPALTAFGTVLTGEFAFLSVMAMVFGLGLAVVTSSTSAYVSELARAQSYGSALGVLSTIMDVGHASGPIVTGLLVVALGYQPAFIIVGVGVMIASGTYAVLSREPEKTREAVN